MKADDEEADNVGRGGSVSRIFLSHSGLDTRVAIALKRWLVEQDPPLANEIFLDVDPVTGLRTGTLWKESLRQANARCEAVICLLSANWEASHECKVEYRTAETLGKQIFVARLEQGTGEELTAEWQRCDLFGDGAHTAVDIGGGASPVQLSTEGLYRLRDGIRGAGIGAESFVWPPPADPQRAPYRGWQPLEEVDAAVFFGRDAQIVRALDAVRGMRLAGLNPLLVILGASGSGKSSFLRAGLLPRLRREDRRFVVCDIVRPERSVLTGVTGLATALAATRMRMGVAEPTLGEIKSACIDGNVDQVAQWALEARRAAADRLVLRGTDDDESAVAPTLVLPLDQAEELFSADAGTEAQTFLMLLAGVLDRVNVAEIGLAVAATIRTDRYEAMQTHPALAGVGTVLFDELKPLPETQFKEVIVGPAQRATEGGQRLHVAPDLVDQLLADAGQGADTLPMLALTLSRLYTDYASTGELTLAHYHSFGGMRHVVQTEVDDVLSRDPDERAGQLAALRAAFIPWLATVNPDNDQPMRRVARWSDLPETSRPLIEALVAKRLMVTDERDGHVVVEVALESLLRQWDELAGWLAEQRHNIKAVDDILRTATAWQSSGHDGSWLLTGTRLSEAEKLLKTTEFASSLREASAFLQSARKAEDARLQAEEDHRRAEEDRRQAEVQHAQELQRTAEAHAAELEITTARAKAAQHTAEANLRVATVQRLVAEALSMLDGNISGGDIRAIQQILAAHSLDPGSNITRDAIFVAVVKLASTEKIIDCSIEGCPDGDSTDSDEDRSFVVGSDGDARAVEAGTRSAGNPRGFAQRALWEVAFSPDGCRLASAGGDGVVRVWNADTGELVGLLAGHTGAVMSVVFSPDGHRLASASLDGMVRVWNADTYYLIGSFHGRPGGAMCVDFSPDGNRLIVGGVGHKVRLWNAHTGYPESKPFDAGYKGHNVEDVAFSPDGGLFATATGNQLEIWKADPQTLVGRWVSAGANMDHVGPAQSVAFSPDGKRIVSAGVDGTVRVWDTNVDPASAPMKGHTGQVFCARFNCDGRRVASAGADGTIRVWNTAPSALFVDSNPIDNWIDKNVRNVTIDHKSITAVVFSPDGSWLAAAGGDGKVRLWNVQTGQVEWTYTSRKDAVVLGVAFSPDGSRLAAAGADNIVRLWNVDEGKFVRSIDAHYREVRGVAFSPCGRRVVSAGGDGVVRMWDADTGQYLAVFGGHSGPVTSVAFRPDGHRLAAAGEDGTVRVWDVATGDATGAPIIGRSGALYGIAFGPDGRRLASAGFDGTIRVWDAKTGEPLGAPILGHSGEVWSVTFSPGGRRVASAGADGTVRVWEADAGRLIGQPLTGHTAAVRSVAFSPDGRWLASGGQDDSVRLWPARSSPDALCAKLTTNMSRRHWHDWVSPDIEYIAACSSLPIPD